MKRNNHIRLKRQVVSSLGKEDEKPDIFATTKSKLYQIPFNSKLKKDKIKGNLISLIKVPESSQNNNK